MKKSIFSSAAMVIGITLASAGAAAASPAYFKIDNTSFTHIYFHNDSTGTSSDASFAVNNSNVDFTVTADVTADFGNGFAQMSPSNKNDVLKDVVITPTNPLLYTAFSFHGKDAEANQTIYMTVTDQSGNTQTFDWFQDKAHQEFGEFGISANMPGETIARIEITNSGGFDQVKQLTASAAPEPAAWALMMVAVGGMGAALRSRRRKTVAA